MKEGKGKVWIFRETGEVRRPRANESFLNGSLFCTSDSDDDFEGSFPILSLTILDHDPFEPIREVYEKYKHFDKLLSNLGLIEDDILFALAGEFYRAIKKAVEGV